MNTRSHTKLKASALTCREMGLTDDDSAILMRNPARSFIGMSDDQRAFDQARYQHRTRPWRDLKRRQEASRCESFSDDDRLAPGGER